jgi:hypothetical protein
MIIALDLDGTLLTHEWPNLGKDIGAFDWLLPLQRQHPDLKYILWTVRSGELLLAAVRYCAHRELEFWSVNVNPEQRHWSSSNKAHAHLYVDDTALGARLIYPASEARPYVDWGVMGPMLEDRVAWYYNEQRG